MEHVNGWCFRGIYKGGLWENDLHVSAILGKGYSPGCRASKTAIFGCRANKDHNLPGCRVNKGMVARPPGE